MILLWSRDNTENFCHAPLAKFCNTTKLKICFCITASDYTQNINYRAGNSCLLYTLPVSCFPRSLNTDLCQCYWLLGQGWRWTENDGYVQNVSSKVQCSSEWGCKCLCDSLCQNPLPRFCGKSGHWGTFGTTVIRYGILWQHKSESLKAELCILDTSFYEGL